MNAPESVPETVQGQANTNSPVSHWIETSVGKQECAHCGAVVSGAYCSECGQRQLHERLSFGTFLKELASKLTDLDRGLIHTLLLLFFKPGYVAREYVRGNQREFTNPLTCFFIGTGIQLLMLWVVQDGLRETMIQQARQTQVSQGNSSGQMSKLETMLGNPLEQVMADTYVLAIQQAYGYAALLCFTLPMAFLLKVFHQGLGEDFRVGETAVFTLYVFTPILAVTGFMAPLAFWWGTSVHMLVAISVYILFSQLGHTHFFRPAWLPRLLTGLATGLSFVPFACSLVAIFLATFLARIGWALYMAQ